MHDLLREDLIGIRTPDGERVVSLPALLSLLSEGKVDGYTGLRAHQADPWHVFLVQIAVSIQARQPRDAPPADPGYWREGLLDLAEGQATAWELLVDDVTLPAFLQHPWSGWAEEAEAYKAKRDRKGNISVAPKAATPDELDVLVTAKNHDMKAARVAEGTAESWMYALLLYQTTSGFLGSGNYGIVRMNGGFASRPFVSWDSDLHPSRRFVEQLSGLSTMRASLVQRYGYRDRGVVLTWLRRWQRNAHQYGLSDLEPFFVESPRAVRLYAVPDRSIVALGATTGARQIGPKSLENGDVGDPWIPLKTDTRAAMTLSADGFTPERLTSLLFEQDFELTPLQRPRPGTGSGWFSASVLVRGQGKTEGFHRAALPVPAKARWALGQKDRRDAMATFAQTLLGDAKVVRSALSLALTLYTEGGPEDADFDRKAVKSWVAQGLDDFRSHWESGYFPTLWRAAVEDREAIRRDWQQTLVTHARNLLDEAGTRLPLPSNRRWRALVQASNAFHGSLHRQGIALGDHSPVTEEATP